MGSLGSTANKYGSIVIARAPHKLTMNFLTRKQGKVIKIFRFFSLLYQHNPEGRVFSQQYCLSPREFLGWLRLNRQKIRWQAKLIDVMSLWLPWGAGKFLTKVLKRA
jgi:hypothetical protein